MSESGVGIGETLIADNFEFSILSIKTCPAVSNALGVEYVAESGNEYVFCVMGAKNSSSDTQNMMNVNFNGYVDDTKITIVSVVGEIEGYMPLLGAVSADKTFEGYTVWEVPQGWEKLEFSYIDALSGQDSDSFVIYSSDIE